jgi:integrase
MARAQAPREVEALRRGDAVQLRRRQLPTLSELVDEYVGQHAAEANTLRTLKERLRYATEGPKLDGQGGFGNLRIDRLTVTEIGAWRKRLPERSAWGIHKALRQLLGYAVRAKLLDENPASLVPNPEPKRREVPTFESVEDLEAIGDELSPAFAPIPVFVGLTGLRCSEWLALERGDVDRRAGVVHVRRVFTDRKVKLYGKQAGLLRAVPLPVRAAESLAALPPRLDTPLLFPGARGGYLNLHEWRRDEWTPAVKAAGLEHRSPTPFGTPSPRSRSLPACPCSSSPASWARAWRRSRRPTATYSPTASRGRERLWTRIWRAASRGRLKANEPRLCPERDRRNL